MRMTAQVLKNTCGTTTADRGEEREHAACSGLTFLAFGSSSSAVSEAAMASNSAGRAENADDTPTLKCE